MSSTTPLSPSDERLWATLIHIGGIILSWVAALIGYIVLRHRGAFIREHTTTALNFQITLFIASAIGSVLTVIFVGYLILAAVWVINIVFSIIAAIKANQGESYTYPLAITFIK